MKELEFLIQLQDVDLKIEKAEKEKKILQSRLKELQEKLETLEKDLLEKKQRLKDLRKEKMEKELQIKEIEERLQKHEEEKYKVKSQDEFEAVEREIAILEKNKDKEEDFLLELMEEEDNLLNILPSAEKEFQENKEKLLREKESLTNKIVELEKNKKSLMEKREKLSPQINKVYYNQYEQLRKTKNGLAVVAVKDGTCSGCNMRVPPSLIGQMRRNQIVYCESCNRIIYLGNRSGG